MTITINGELIRSAAPANKKKSWHTKPQDPQISLSKPGHLNVEEVMSVLDIPLIVLCARVAYGLVPKPDGYDPCPYWRIETIRKFLLR